MDRTTKLILAVLALLMICAICFIGYVVMGFPPFERPPNSVPDSLPEITPTIAPTTPPPTPRPQAPTPITAETSLPRCLATELLNLRSGPGTNYDPPIKLLPGDTGLKPLARNREGDWLQVQLPETGETGWVNRSFVTCNLEIASLPEGETPPLLATCQFETPAVFKAVWQKHQDALGCPEQNQVTGGQFVEQQFEKGRMFWVGELDWFFVSLGGNTGIWYAFRDAATFDALFKPNHEGPSCEPDAQRLPGQVQPIRGFGAIWCGQFDGVNFQRALGFATEKEHGEGGDSFLAFERGFMLRDSQNQTYIFFVEDIEKGTYSVQ